MEKTAKSLYVANLVEKMVSTTPDNWYRQDMEDVCYLVGMWVRWQGAETEQDKVKVTVRALKKLQNC